MQKIYEEYHIDSLDDLMAVVGYGKVSPKHVVHHFLPEEETKKGRTACPDEKKGCGDGADRRVADGDRGYHGPVRKVLRSDPRGRDHRLYLARHGGLPFIRPIARMSRIWIPERLVDVQWDIREKREYPVQMRIVCNDKKGLLADISSAISSLDVNITHAEINISQDGQAHCEFSVNVIDLNQFNKIIAVDQESAGGHLRGETLASHETEAAGEVFRDDSN